jgi:hypothetical protein
MVYRGNNLTSDVASFTFLPNLSLVFLAVISAFLLSKIPLPFPLNSFLGSLSAS